MCVCLINCILDRVIICKLETIQQSLPTIMLANFSFTLFLVQVFRSIRSGYVVRREGVFGLKSNQVGKLVRAAKLASSPINRTKGITLGPVWIVQC